MTAVLLLGAGMPLIEQVQNTPMMILAVLLCCEGIALLALWRALRSWRSRHGVQIGWNLP
jgi:hypothetical protein